MTRRAKLLITVAVLMLVLAFAIVTAPNHQEPKFAIGPALPAGTVRPQLINDFFNGAVLLAPDGSVWTWGMQQGGPPIPISDRSIPKRIDPGSDWRQVAIANMNTRLVGLKEDGSLWSWNSLTPGKPPSRIGSETNWLQISGNVSHCMALKTDGSLWGWGQDDMGQLGDGSSNTQSAPIRIGADSDWRMISAGSWNSYALKQDGTLWGWGMGPSATLPRTNDLVPTQINPGTTWKTIAAGDFHLLALRSDGTLWIKGQNAHVTAQAYFTNKPGQSPDTTKLTQIGTDQDWVQIYSGQNCFYARKQEGIWWVCGDDASQKLGVAVPPKQPVRAPLEFEPWAFSTGGETTLLLAPDGNLWTWGKRLGSHEPVTLTVRLKTWAAYAGQWWRNRHSGRPFYPGSIGQDDAIVDRAPHLLWSLPEDVRRKLGKEGAGSNSNSATAN